MRNMLAVFATVCALLLQVVTLSFPLLTGRLMDLLNRKHWNDYVLLLGALCLIPVLQGFMEWGKAYSLTRWAETNSAKLRGSLLDRLLEVPIHYFSSSKTGEVITRSTEDVVQVTDFQKMKLELAEHGFVMLFTLAALADINPVLLIMITTGSLLYVLQTKVIAPYLTRVYRKSMGTQDLYNEYVRESVQMIGLTVISGKSVWEQRRLQQIVNQSRGMEEQMSRLTWLNDSILKAIESVITGSIYFVSAYLLVHNRISIGQLVTAIAFYPPLIQTFGIASQWVHRYKKYCISMERVGDIHDLRADEHQQGEANIPAIDSIAFDQVTFSYPKRGLILKGVSFTLEKGKVTAIVGLSGGGKSTICELLLKLNIPDSGCIRINGQHDLCTYSGSAWRSKIAYAQQSIFFFSGSLQQNLLYGYPQLTLAEVESVAEKLGIAKSVEQREGGYACTVSSDMSGFSGGQKQRLSLVRALLKPKAEVLILDEPTSALDYISEKQVMRTVYERNKEVATLIIAHRLSTILHADTILVLKDGEIVESGKHEDLIRQEGHYYRLYEHELTHKAQIELIVS